MSLSQVFKKRRSHVGQPPTKPKCSRLLLTTLPIDTVEQVQRVVALHAMRWRIELFFRMLKQGWADIGLPLWGGDHHPNNPVRSAKLRATGFGFPRGLKPNRRAS